MSFLDEAFDLNDMPTGTGGDFEPLPAGWYTAKITNAEVKPTKAGTGKYISVRFDILGPTHQGRVVFTNLNTRNPNPKAEEIGRQQLGDIMRAIGIGKLTDTDQLIGGDLSIKLAVRNDEQYGNSNDVKAFKAIEGSTMPTPQAAAPVAAASGGKASPPWMKK
jgi:hypothetical protein